MPMRKTPLQTLNRNMLVLLRRHRSPIRLSGMWPAGLGDDRAFPACGCGDGVGLLEGVGASVVRVLRGVEEGVAVCGAVI